MLRIPAVPGTSPVQYSSSLETTSYAQLQTRRNAVGSALLALEREGRLKTPAVPGPTPVEITHPGIPHFGSSNRAKAGARRGWAVGTWSKNREEWQVVDLACQAYGLVGVSLYETLGPDVARYMWVTASVYHRRPQLEAETSSVPTTARFPSSSPRQTI